MMVLNMVLSIRMLKVMFEKHFTYTHTYYACPNVNKRNKSMCMMNGRLSFSKLKTKVWLVDFKSPNLVTGPRGNYKTLRILLSSIFWRRPAYNPSSKYGELKKFLKIWRLWCSCSHTKILCILSQQGIEF
jgi:hypothetical protein